MVPFLNKIFRGKPRDLFARYRLRGAEPKLTKPKNYAENNSFDYTDVNVSRRVIRKMINSTLFDHKPLEKAKYLDKLTLGNTGMNRIDPIEIPNTNPTYQTTGK
jgi:hypothetical protein